VNIDLPLDQVRTLLAVMDGGTLDAAAATLHVTPSAVSQRIKALEQRTGRVLLMRTKPVQLTESGEAVVRFARQLARLEQDACAELGMSGASGPNRLPIAVNADSLATWFLPAITQVSEKLGICLELHRADEGYTTALLREGRVMAAVTSSPDPVQGCSVRQLGHMRYLSVASPTFAARWLDGWPETPLRKVIVDAPVVTFDSHDDLQDSFVRTLTHHRGASARRHAVPSSDGFVDAVVAGMGWGMVPQVQAEPRIRSGSLINLAAERPIDVPLFWQQWKLDSPALATVADAVTQAASGGNPSLLATSTSPQKSRDSRTPKRPR
jgi:LysR family transcriptional regulator (chromosome initiation inhibitor)